MSATALQLNWSSVMFASTSLTRVTSVMFSQGGELIEFSGDNNRYPVVIANNINRPRVQVSGGDIATLQSLGVGTTGTFTAVQNDALGASGGAINWTMTNTVSQGLEQGGGQWGQFGTGSWTGRAYASDGATNPLSFTRS